MNNYFRKLRDFEKSLELKNLESTLKEDFRQLKNDAVSLSDRDIRLDVRVIGVGGFILPLDIMQIGLSSLRYGIGYVGEYALNIPERIKRV